MNDVTVAGFPLVAARALAGGTWRESERTTEIRDPYRGSVVGTAPISSAADLDAALSAAVGACDKAAALPGYERAALLRRIAVLIERDIKGLAELMTRETGKALKDSEGEIRRSLETFQLAAEEAIRIEGRHVPLDGSAMGAGRMAFLMRFPVGVVAAITPWNYPLNQIALKVAPALAAGCTVVLKPSEIAPFNAFILAEVIEAAGLPKGVFNLVTGYGPTVGEALVNHPQVDMISFTGSTRAGKRISELAAQTVKRVALELGGKSASVVLDDADLAAAVKSTVNMCYLNSGQTCTALTRMLVPESKYEEAAKIAAEVAKAFTPGDPLSETTRLGPLSSQMQLERVRGYIRKGVAEGAELLTGGAEAPEGVPAGGYYVKPTVFGKVKPGSTIEQEEIFGPVLSIVTYKDEEDAIRIANGTVYGLAGAVWSKDEQRAQKVARRIRAGQVDVNGGAFNMMAPFGGFKQSGHGREAGVYGLEEFLEYKSLQLKG